MKRKFKLDAEGFGFMPLSRHEADRRRKQRKNAKVSPYSEFFPNGIKYVISEDENAFAKDPFVKVVLGAFPAFLRGEFEETVYTMQAAYPALHANDDCAWVLFRDIVSEAGPTAGGSAPKKSRNVTRVSAVPNGRRKRLQRELRALIAASAKEVEAIRLSRFCDPSFTTLVVMSKVVLRRHWQAAYETLRARPQARRLRTGGARSKSAIDPFTLRMRKPLGTTAAYVARALWRYRDQITLSPNDMFECISEWYNIASGSLKREYARAQSKVRTKKDILDARLNHFNEDRRAAFDQRKRGTRYEARIARIDDRISRCKDALGREQWAEQQGNAIVESLFFHHLVP